jgi:hypothetical protein
MPSINGADHVEPRKFLPRFLGIHFDEVDDAMDEREGQSIPSDFSIRSSSRRVRCP